MKKSKIAIGLLILAVIAALAWLRISGKVENVNEPATEVTVRVSKISRATLRAYVTAYGTVETEPTGEHPAAGALVSPNVSGIVTAIKCIEGQHVEKGAILVQLDSRAADAAVEKAQEALKFAEKTAERQRTLIEAEGTSQRQLLDSEQALAAARGELAQARIQQALMRVEAPVSGTVMRINASPGEAVDLTTTLIELADLDRLVVRAELPSAELSSLVVGRSAEVSYDNTVSPVSGLLKYIGSRVEPKTGTAEIRVSLPAGSGLHPGQFVKLRIVSQEHEGCLAVPVESVVRGADGGQAVALVQADSAVLHPVKVDIIDGEQAEILAENLQSGMAVVTEGAYGLPNGARVRILE